MSRLGDIFGRKPVFLIGMVMQIFVTAGLLITNDVKFAYGLVFMIGFAVTGK